MDNNCDLERDLIFGAISRERTAQDNEWGGPAHDDAHAPNDWCDFIDKQTTLARMLDPSKFVDYERRMVKIAALAIAAIESSKRQRS